MTTAQQIFDVTDKVAFITGAGSGLGRAMAEVLAANGAKLVLFDVSAKGLETTVAELGGAEVETVVGDVSDEAAVEGAIATCITRFGRLDIACANAGIADPEPARLDGYKSENWHKTVGINLDGVFYVNRAAIREMLNTGGGKVINTASMWGLAGAAAVAPLPAYTATKGAVVNLTRELGLEYAKDNVQVNAICPGFFDTAIGDPNDPDFAKATTDFTPMGRTAKAEEIMGTVLYLASSASDFVTGTSLVIDGGCAAR
jgi:NAD(P)-dependent dehydrogenase (short-subunit alcohol dehydrogenase family)